MYSSYRSKRCGCSSVTSKLTFNELNVKFTVQLPVTFNANVEYTRNFDVFGCLEKLQTYFMGKQQNKTPNITNVMPNITNVNKETSMA